MEIQATKCLDCKMPAVMIINSQDDALEEYSLFCIKQYEVVDLTRNPMPQGQLPFQPQYQPPYNLQD